METERARCTCPCHRGDINMMHVMACCDNGWIEIPKSKKKMEEEKCPNCEGGYTSARQRLQAIVHLLMMSGEDSRRKVNHPYFGLIERILEGFSAVPSKEMSDLTEGLAGRKLRTFGHDSIDGWVAEKKIIASAGLDPETWGICTHCEEGIIKKNNK